VLTYFGDREVIYRAGFNRKYPCAYSTHQAKKAHEDQTRNIWYYPRERAQDHEDRALDLRTRRLTKDARAAYKMFA
jgi:hypothetical protein